MKTLQLDLDYRCPKARTHKHSGSRCPNHTEAVCIYCLQPIYRAHKRDCHWGTKPEFDFVVADPCILPGGVVE